ncbi:hypothetical protein FFI87_004405 [Burkholderia sp. KBS0801]|nr:hypothetical protein FFI87_004405 [Burkholderia sp. KBS0801]
MHVACKQCSENPPLVYCAFVANCNSTRARPARGRAVRIRYSPCRSRDSVRPVKPRRAGRSVLPAAVSAAGALP